MNDRVVTHEIPSVAFIQLNNCKYDVADLINLTFFGQDFNVFINKRSLSGNTPMKLANDDASIMWYQKKKLYVSNENFNETVSIIKTHGVVNSQNNKKMLDFLQDSVSSIVFLADVDFGKNGEE